MPDEGKDLRSHWQLEPDLAFLNHGSFGACPGPVLARQAELRQRIERQPVQFFVRDLEQLLDTARTELADFLGADPQDLVWVANATSGVNAVLRSMRLGAGDELLTTDHEYNACRNALDFVAARAAARVVVVPIPFPLRRVDDVVEAMLGRVTERTRLVLVDHVTSPTGMVLPLETLLPELAARGVEVLVDGAHAPGMLELDVAALGATYYTGNCHKWICAPKGAGFLWVRRDRQIDVRPPVISHGANSPRKDRSRFRIEFDWVGTDDPTAALCVPEALRFMGSLLPGGWNEVRSRNRSLARAARRVLCEARGIAPPCPESMLGSLVSLPLPDGGNTEPASPLYADPLQSALLERYRIEVPVVPWPAAPRRLLRVSAQLYNGLAEYERLARALDELL